MGSLPPLLTFLVALVSGWVHRHQSIVIEFVQAENRVLKERLRGKRTLFTDEERALLARKAKAVGRKALLELDTMVSPDTLMRWHRRLVAQKWDFSRRRGPGRPGIMREISQLIVRMAVDNPGWGCTRIQGALENLNHKVGRNLLDDAEGVLHGKRSLIIDRDSKYSLRFREFVQEGGTEVIRLPPLSPNRNAFAERLVRSVKEECLEELIFVGQGSLRRAITEYVARYHEERNHQGLENRLIRRKPANAANDAAIDRPTRLGGMLGYCHRAAA